MRFYSISFFTRLTIRNLIMEVMSWKINYLAVVTNLFYFIKSITSYNYLDANMGKLS